MTDNYVPPTALSSPEVVEEDGVMMVNKGSTTEKVSVASVTQTAKNTVYKIESMAQEGPLSFRVLGFLGGLFMMFTSAWSIITRVIVLSPITALISAYTFLFGFFIVILEGKVFIPPLAHFQRRLFFYAHFLSFVSGRGLLYFFAGSLQLSQWHFWEIISGGFMCAIGILSLLTGRASYTKMQQLRMSISDEAFLYQKFKEHDVNADTFLDISEFENLIKDLLSTGNNGEAEMMNNNELEAAFAMIDRDDNRKISLDDFKTWWSNYEAYESGWTSHVV